MSARLIVSSLLMLAVALPLAAETWVRGAVLLHRVSGELVVTELGSTSFELGPGDAPVALPGQINCEASHGSSVLFSASTRGHILFEGAGSFAFERFEQVIPEAETWLAARREASQSRIIVNFRAGQLTLDSRTMSDVSQYLVETPLGRVTVQRALWQMRIAFDPRSRVYDFTITCSDGRVRFTNLQGQQYTLQPGQRLSGAGVRTAPSIEVAEMGDRAHEQVRQFLDLVDEYSLASDDLQTYEAHFQEIAQVKASSGFGQSELNKRNSDRRPIVIDYARDPVPVTPFRGAVPSPSFSNADLF